MELLVIPLFIISIGLLPISIFSLTVYALFGTIPGFYYLIIFLIISAPFHIYIIRLTNITNYFQRKFAKSFKDISKKVESTSPNIFLFLSLGPIFPYIAVLLYVASLNKNIFTLSTYLLTSTIPGVLLIFLVTHGIIGEDMSWPLRILLIFIGISLFLLTRKKLK